MGASHEHKAVSRESLWKNALEKEVEDGLVQMTGVKSEDHTVFARVTKGDLTIGVVLESIVDEVWQNVARGILEKKEQIETIDSHPPAEMLLELGAVWLVNEALWSKGQDAHSHRLSPLDQTTVPDWQDMTLRVHFVPDRFHVANEYDWSKYCRGLLIGRQIEATIDGEPVHVPVMEGLPDSKDGVIVYEDDRLGFAILHKPGNMPVHATRSNHKEDVVSMFTHALNDECLHKERKFHVSVPQRHDANLDVETSGLLAVATSTDFAHYLTAQLDDHDDPPPNSVTRIFRCLVCVKDAERIHLLEHFANSGKLITHYVDATAPAKKFWRHKPEKSNNNNNSNSKHGGNHNNNHNSKHGSNHGSNNHNHNNNNHDWKECHLRIWNVGDDSFRAACVQSLYPDSMDGNLAHRLWGPDSPTPAEDLGVAYVMELRVQVVGSTTSSTTTTSTTNSSATHFYEAKQQVRGQLAALGFPVVGDTLRGGGVCELHCHKHKWNRLALQCCELAFMEPQKDESSPGLVASNRQCVFRLHQAWWSEYIQLYESYHKMSPDFKK